MADFATIEKIQKIIEDLLKRAEIDAKVSPEDSISRGLVFNITSSESYLVIGRQGANLQALQTLSQAIASKQLKDKPTVFFTLDVDDYRRKREWFLKQSLRQTVDKMVNTGLAVPMEPMSSSERRFIHAFAQGEYPEVETYSEGLDPYRKIVVRPKRLQ